MKNKIIAVLLIPILVIGGILLYKAFQNKNKFPKNQPADIASARAVLYRVLGDRANSVK